MFVALFAAFSKVEKCYKCKGDDCPDSDGPVEGDLDLGEPVTCEDDENEFCYKTGETEDGKGEESRHFRLKAQN